jgi:hypoxanthine phosphoribosyltransferase
VLLTRQQIAGAVARLAAKIRDDYQASAPLLVGVLRGSFIFLADLVRETGIPLSIDFATVESYQGTESTRNVQLVHDIRLPVQGRHVLLVEDIVDTGRTTHFLMERVRLQSPASLKLCALLDKPSRREVPLKIDYLGFTVPDCFLVGYGLDCDQQYRQLPDICALEENDGP